MKARVTIVIPTGVPLQSLLTFIGSAPIQHLTVDMLADKPVKPKSLLRDKVMAELINGGGLPPIAIQPPGMRPVPRRFEKSARALVQETVEQAPGAVTANELQELVVSQGHSQNAAHTALKMLVDTGKIRRLDKGVYGRLDLSPDVPLPPPGPIRRLHKLAGRGREILDKVFADGAVHSRGVVMAAFVKAGMAGKSADSRIAEAVAQGLLVRMGQAVYQLNKKDSNDASPPA